MVSLFFNRITSYSFAQPLPCDFPYPAAVINHTHTRSHKHTQAHAGTHTHTHSTVHPHLILWFSSSLQSELPCFHCSHGLWVIARLSQAICAGSHWLTHLGPGNTPIPTYPCIQLEWPATKRWQSEGIQFVKTCTECAKYSGHLPNVIAQSTF